MTQAFKHAKSHGGVSFKNELLRLVTKCPQQLLSHNELVQEQSKNQQEVLHQ